MAAARTAFLSAAAFLVYCCPRSAFGFVLRDAPRFIAFCDVIGFPILPIRVFGIIASGHHIHPSTHVIDYNKSVRAALNRSDAALDYPRS
jgi:hypothetical protein